MLATLKALNGRLASRVLVQVYCTSGDVRDKCPFMAKSRLEFLLYLISPSRYSTSVQASVLEELDGVWHWPNTMHVAVVGTTLTYYPV